MEEVNRPPTLTFVTAEAIRTAIFRGDLRPGEPLREADLTESLGVSRSTVREALHLLKEDGLVEAIPHRGSFVTQLSPRIVEEIYALRILLEPYAVGSTLESRAYSDLELQDLEALVRQMGQYEDRGDVSATVKLDQEFHQSICKPSNQRLLLDVLRSVGFLTRLCMVSIKIYSSDLIADQLQHQQILDAIREADPVHAERVLRQHLVDARDALLARMGDLDWEQHIG